MSHNIQKQTDTVETLKQIVREEFTVVDTALNTNFKHIQSNYFANERYNSKYFEKTVQKLEQRKQEIYRQIEYVNSAITQKDTLPSPSVIPDTIKIQQELFLSLAANVAMLHDQILDLKEAYIKKYRIDPFKEVERNEEIAMDYKGTMLPGMQNLTLGSHNPQQQNSNTSGGFGGFGGFGSTDNKSTGFSFGNDNKSTNFSFGNDNKSTGFSFGNDNKSTSFSFGNENKSTETTGFTFGNDNKTVGFDFGTGGGLGTPKRKK